MCIYSSKDDIAEQIKTGPFQSESVPAPFLETIKPPAWYEFQTDTLFDKLLPLLCTTVLYMTSRWQNTKF